MAAFPAGCPPSCCTCEGTMTIRFVVAVTDYNWFQVLRQLPHLSTINFWTPSTRHFRALQAGDCFLFKLHAPHNMIVGRGTFDHFKIVPSSTAWEEFGTANGARSAEEMRNAIARYQPSGSGRQGDFAIGCRILTEPQFFDESDWIDPPPSWKPNIVTLKTYDTSNNEGLALWQEVQYRLTARGAAPDQSKC